jgi:hypothetical protein
MRFHTPPANQGQIVEVSYACSEGYVIRRRYDQSDRTTDYAIAKCLNDDDGDYWNGAPANKRWSALTGAKLERWLRDEDAA